MANPNPRTTIPIDKALHERFKVVAKANRYSMKVMMEIMVEEFEKKQTESTTRDWRDAYSDSLEKELETLGAEHMEEYSKLEVLYNEAVDLLAEHNVPVPRDSTLYYCVENKLEGK